MKTLHTYGDLKCIVENIELIEVLRDSALVNDKTVFSISMSDEGIYEISPIRLGEACSSNPLTLMDDGTIRVAKFSSGPTVPALNSTTEVLEYLQSNEDNVKSKVQAVIKFS